MIFEKTLILLTGLQLFSSFESKLGFLIIGVTTAVFNWFGKVPEASELLIMAMSGDMRMSTVTFNSQGGKNIQYALLVWKIHDDLVYVLFRQLIE